MIQVSHLERIVAMCIEHLDTGLSPREARFMSHECAVSNDGTHKQSRVRLWQERTGRKCLHRRAPFPEGPCGLVDLEIG